MKKYTNNKLLSIMEKCIKNKSTKNFQIIFGISMGICLKWFFDISKVFRSGKISKNVFKNLKLFFF